MKRILVSAYAINPYKGSEDGMGWNFVLQIARFHKVFAITRENNRIHIEKYQQENPNDSYRNIQFLYYDLPYWLRFWKKGGRGAMLYYLLWQYGVVAFIKKSKLQFDIAHNLNFHNDWTPSFLWKLNKPFVWGPVGHHPLIPAQYLAPYRCSYWLKDRLTWLAKQYFWRFSCSLSRTKKTAAHILCMNSAAPKALRLKTGYSILPSVATQDFGWKKDHEDEYFTVISAGRFVPLKGFDLSISAFARLTAQLPREQKNKCRLLLIGSGAEDSFLKKLVKENNIEAIVSFVPWIEREELLQKFKTASVFLFPSHEGAGMVVAEALSFGLPVVCLDNEGPGEFINSECGIAVAQQKTYTDTVVALSAALQYLFENPQHRNDLRKAARQRFERFFHWDRRGEHLQKIYAAI